MLCTSWCELKLSSGGRRADVCNFDVFHFLLRAPPELATAELGLDPAAQYRCVGNARGAGQKRLAIS